MPDIALSENEMERIRMRYQRGETSSRGDTRVLLAEIERLKQHVVDLNHDLEATIKECNERHG